jgi:hypothetical protein
MLVLLFEFSAAILVHNGMKKFVYSLIVASLALSPALLAGDATQDKPACCDKAKATCPAGADKASCPADKGTCPMSGKKADKQAKKAAKKAEKAAKKAEQENK